MSLDCDLEDMDVKQNPPTKIPFEWEEILGSCGSVHRAKVFGGWIFSFQTDKNLSATFIPDPFHQWSVEG